MKKQPQSLDSLSRVIDTINDRLRVPWISGAQQVDISVIPPLILLPVFLHIAALHYLLGILVLTAVPIMVLLYYYFTHRKKGRTLFFLSLSFFSLFYMFYLFITEVVPRGDVNHLQLAAVMSGVALTVISLIITKRAPGYVRPLPNDIHSTVTYHKPPPEVDAAYLNGAQHQVVISNHEQTGESGTAQRSVQRRNWCDVCKVVRPPRAGHCRICGVCILRLDHHCVWWVHFKKALLIQEGLSHWQSMFGSHFTLKVYLFLFILLFNLTHFLFRFTLLWHEKYLILQKTLKK